jgi:hypothetical protein
MDMFNFSFDANLDPSDFYLLASIIGPEGPSAQAIPEGEEADSPGQIGG